MKTDRQCYRFSNNLTLGSKENSPGFTAVELMVVVAIIVVMTAAAVPAVNGYLTRHSLQYATNELYGDIQLARLRAAKFNRRCRILFNVPLPNQYTIQDIGNNNAFIGIFKVADLGRFRKNVVFVNSPNPADNPPIISLDFLSQGIVNSATLLPAGSDSVFLTNKDNFEFYQVRISLAGGTGVYRWDPHLLKWDEGK